MKLKILSIAIILTVVFGNFAVFANDEFSAKYQSDINTLTIDMKTQSPNKNVGIIIIPNDILISSLTAQDYNEKKYPLLTKTTDKSGALHTVIPMPLYLESGMYKAYVNYLSQSKTVTFSYINMVQAEKRVESLNSLGEVEFKNMLKDNIKDFGVDKDLYNLYANDISMNLYNQKPTNGYTATDFINSLNGFLGLYMIKANNDAEKTVETYQSAFNIDYATQYKPLSTIVKDKFCLYIKNADLKEKTPKDTFMQNLILSRINGDGNYTFVKDTIMLYNKYLDINLEAYNGLSEFSQSQVINDLANEIIGEFSQIKTKFDEFVGKYTQSIGGGGGSTGGGGGGGSKVDFSYEPTTAKKEKYNDILNHWGYSFINELCEKNIINGFEDGSFKPDCNITRAEFSKIMATALNLPLTQKSNFSDVSQTQWYAKYVGAVASVGFVNGYNGEFRPNDAITREDVAVILNRAFLYKNINLSGEYSFEDKDDISAYAQQTVGILAKNDVITGYQNKFLPKNHTTRAEASSLISKMLKIMGV